MDFESVKEMIGEEINGLTFETKDNEKSKFIRIEREVYSFEPDLCVLVEIDGKISRYSLMKAIKLNYIIFKISTYAIACFESWLYEKRKKRIKEE